MLVLPHLPNSMSVHMSVRSVHGYVFVNQHQGKSLLLRKKVRKLQQPQQQHQKLQ